MSKVDEQAERHAFEPYQFDLMYCGVILESGLVPRYCMQLKTDPVHLSDDVANDRFIPFGEQAERLPEKRGCRECGQLWFHDPVLMPIRHRSEIRACITAT